MPKVNPEILAWARETAGLSLEEAVQKLSLREARGVSAVDRLSELEEGKVNPSRPMLVKMAKKYRRPLLVFYLSAPPRKSNRGQDFRTLPDNYSVLDNALLDVLIRDILARQSMVRAMLEDEEEIDPLKFIGSLSMADGVARLVASIREILQVSQEEFYAQSSAEAAFSLLRTKAEGVGVFVLLIGNLGSHHTTMQPEIFRGFALADRIAPFVVINDQDSHAAWSFTLLHELAHLWLGQTGVSGAFAGTAVEQFCNDVAGEFLLSQAEIDKLNMKDAGSFEEAQYLISDFANERNLSSSMIAYKLLRRGVIQLDVWKALSESFRDMWLQERQKHRERSSGTEEGPNYYIVRKHRVGNALIQLVDRMMAGGVLSTSKAGKMLGVKAKNVGNLIEASRSGY